VVVAKPCLDELVELGNLLVEGRHLIGQCVHQLRGQPFAREAGVLAFCGLDGRLGELIGVADTAIAKPGLQSLGAEPSWGIGRPIDGSHRRQKFESHTRRPWAGQPCEGLARSQART
jgi:hypothetical protein